MSCHKREKGWRSWRPPTSHHYPYQRSCLPCGCPSVASRVKAKQARPYHTHYRLRGLDTGCSVKSNPHRESGTRCGPRQTLDCHIKLLSFGSSLLRSHITAFPSSYFVSGGKESSSTRRYSKPIFHITYRPQGSRVTRSTSGNGRAAGQSAHPGRAPRPDPSLCATNWQGQTDRDRPPRPPRDTPMRRAMVRAIGACQEKIQERQTRSASSSHRPGSPSE